MEFYMLDITILIILKYFISRQILDTVPERTKRRRRVTNLQLNKSQ